MAALAIQVDEDVRSIVNAVNKPKPKPEALATYRQWLATAPKGWKVAGDVVNHAEHAILDTIQGTPLVVEGVKASLVAQRGELGYVEASPLERLLIDQIVVCWLQLYIAQRSYAITMGESVTLTVGMYWERRLSMVQRRYLRAIETLARVRRLAIPVQINIAAEGGQQVNVAR